MSMKIDTVRNLFIKACNSSAPLGKKSSATNDLIEFYNKGTQNPSVAKAIITNETDKALSLPVCTCPQWFYSYNILKKQPQVKPAYESFENAFEAMYPKTGKLREFLIDKSRLSFEKVLPKMSPNQKTAAKAYLA